MIARNVAFHIAFALLLICAATAYPQDQQVPSSDQAAEGKDKLTGSFEIDGLNRYIFRCMPLGTQRGVLQPSITAGYKGFSANVRGSIDTNQHSGKTWNETDLTLSYAHAIDKLTLTGGYIYAHDAYGTQVLFVNGTYNTISHPSLSVSRDIGRFVGDYINLSFAPSFPVLKSASGKVTLDPGAGFGYEIGTSNYWKEYVADKGYVGSRFSGPLDGNVTLGLTVPVTKRFSVQPIAQYSFPLSARAGSTILDSSGSHGLTREGQLRSAFVYGLNAKLRF